MTTTVVLNKPKILMKNTILTTSLLTLFTVSTQASIILTEDFAAIDDWTFDDNSDNQGGLLTSTAVAGNTAIHELFGADGDDNEGTLTRTISTVGFTDITIDFSAFQRAAGTFEGSEAFNIEVVTSSGTTSLSSGPILGLLSTGADGSATAADSFTLTAEALGAAADNSSFDIRITINTGFWNGAQNTREEYHLENLVVNGTAIVPEPSSTALLGLGGLALIHRRRK